MADARGGKSDSAPSIKKRKQAMNIVYRILISIGLLVMHYIGIVLPLTEFFLIYILLFNPRWFRNFLNNMAAK
jgi:hypothetical protein